MPRLTKKLIAEAACQRAEFFLWDDEVKGFGVRVKPSGAKSFVLKYRVATATRRHTISKVGSPYTVEEARTKARELLRGIADGIDPADVKAQAREAVTVAQLADIYLKEGPTRKPNKKASSWANDRSVINRHIKPLLGRKLASALDQAAVSKFQADVAAGKTAADVKTKPRGRAIVTGGKRAASLATTTLRAMYSHGVATGRVVTNPADGVETFKTERREVYLSEVDVAFIAEAITALEDEAEINRTMADAIRVLMISGARKNEILSLQRPWVDYERSGFRLPDSKTGWKFIPVAAPVLAIIADRPRGTDAEEADDVPYVFPAARGKGHTTGVPKAWGRVKVRAAGLAKAWYLEQGKDAVTAPTFKGVRLHDLRHSFASFAVADGTSLYLLGKVLGHRQARTTEGYAHLRDDPLRAVAERTGGKIADAMKLKPTQRSADVIRFKPR